MASLPSLIQPYTKLGRAGAIPQGSAWQPHPSYYVSAWPPHPSLDKSAWPPRPSYNGRPGHPIQPYTSRLGDRIHAIKIGMATLSRPIQIGLATPSSPIRIRLAIYPSRQNTGGQPNQPYTTRLLHRDPPQSGGGEGVQEAPRAPPGFHSAGRGARGTAGPRRGKSELRQRELSQHRVARPDAPAKWRA